MMDQDLSEKKPNVPVGVLLDPPTIGKSVWFGCSLSKGCSQPALLPRLYLSTIYLTFYQFSI